MKTFKQIITYSFLTVLILTATISEAHFTTKGPWGGSVKCMLTTDTLIFVGTANGGVFRSSSSAATSWRYANYTGLSNASINSLANIGGYVLAATQGGGVFKTSDAGNSWISPNTGLTNKNVSALVTANDHVLAGTTGGGIFMSHDSGSTWEQSNVGLTNLTVTCFAFNGTTIYAGTQAGVFISIDEGDSWTAINTGLSDLGIKSITTASDKIFIATASGVFSTETDITNWVLTNTGLQNITVNNLMQNDGTLYASTETGVYTSDTGNISWAAQNTGYTGNVNTTVAYNGKLFSGTQEDGIYRSNSVSNINWVQLNTGLNNLEIYAIYNDGILVLAATNKGLFVSKDLAANYILSNNGLTDSLHITSLVFGGSKLYAATQNNGVFVSNDTGATWAPCNTQLTQNNIIKLIATDTYLFAAAANGEVFSTLLSTINWTANTGLPTGIVPTSFATDGSTHVFLGTASQGVFMCMDNQSWTASNNGLANLHVTSLAISGSTIFAGTIGAGVFKSPLMGSWNAVNTGLPTQNILSLCASGAWVAAGYTGGVHVTANNGTSWQAPNVIMYLPSYADVNAISFTPASTRIFVSTPYNCLYSNGIAELPTALQQITNNIGSIEVSPNPNNGSFTIDLTNVKATVQQVLVYNIVGKKVNQFDVNKNVLSADIVLNEAAGIYFVSIQTDMGMVSQKVVVR
jgi:hypothetical protein